MTILLTGFLTCLALIVAIGPQSAWLLRQGLRRDRVLLAVTCCIFGDILLIALGTAGVGAVLDHAPWLMEVLRWLGVSYLTWFAYRSFRSARRAGQALKPGVHVELSSQQHDDDAPAGSGGGGGALKQAQRVQVTRISSIAATGLSVSILNPHAWVDTMVVLGTMANTFGDQRWLFAGGAVLASIIWFSALALGGAVLSKWLNRPRTWQVLDILVGAIMLVVAGLLAFSGF
ncbi:LysE/ArgO family amino acid transporter [Nesterenkonia sandarakina]|uniref:L-lysine exporter family protein LysE/ArgO n=1 Tax=Nesterenkonia sandarakina TaxID=272918 RepID=A0A2T0YNK5_9MICC|nr:LysE/ArgO family amino acid transporter [Nesterenkonia sandarakina]PRZ16709.1 L-lysine exporter family protein LysE/ArgO [Nesterenkonia sandarakina]